MPIASLHSVPSRGLFVHFPSPRFRSNTPISMISTNNGRDSFENKDKSVLSAFISTLSEHRPTSLTQPLSSGVYSTSSPPLYSTLDFGNPTLTKNLENVVEAFDKYNPKRAILRITIGRSPARRHVQRHISRNARRMPTEWPKDWHHCWKRTSVGYSRYRPNLVV
jgi:hypothetical protein